MKPPNPPKGMRHATDDPLLPFVVAARAGDRSAERELLTRVGPTVFAVARAARADDERQLSAVALDALIGTLKALPTFRGDEVVRDVVARITLEKARLNLGGLAAPDDEILGRARALGEHALRVGDVSRIAGLVERALQDDAAVLVSHIALSPTKRSKRPTYSLRRVALISLGIALGLWGLSRVVAGAMGWLGG
ncbi:MAG: hypothetical protein QM756_47415 [Polyangiaceae bacterium]